MKQVFIILLVLVLLLIVFVVGPWLLIYIGISSEEDPPKPIYTYGEFPFYLEYEIKGEVVIIQDTVIVKYDGIGMSEGSGGKYIKWKKTLASGKKEVILYQNAERESVIFNVIDQNYLEEERFESSKVPTIIKSEGGSSSLLGSNIKLMNDYGIRIIKFEYGEPLKE